MILGHSGTVFLRIVDSGIADTLESSSGNLTLILHQKGAPFPRQGHITYSMHNPRENFCQLPDISH